MSAIPALHAAPPDAPSPPLPIRGLVYASGAMAQLAQRIARFAQSETTVLIQGETGTGKEVCAQAVHYLSRRVGKPWVALNCGAIPGELVEDELFGHVRGAYTTAVGARLGLVREAEGGTLLLDDVDCLPLTAQAKLLRFLQEREYRPVGSNQLVHADVRVIAASNRDLHALAQRGDFRQDLRAVFASQGPHLGAVDLEFDDGSRAADAGTDDAESFQSAKARMVSDFERHYVERLLARSGGNIAQAARGAKKNRRAFFELMRKHGIDAERFRGPLA